MLQRKNIPISEIHKVPNYGKPFPFLPKSARERLQILSIFNKRLLKVLGLRGFLIFCLYSLPRWYKVTKKHKHGIAEMRKSYGYLAKLNWTFLHVIYEALEKRNGKEAAFKFCKACMQDIAKYSMMNYYQVKYISRFEDPYEAFWELYKSMLNNDPNYEGEVFEDNTIKVSIIHKCSLCRIAKMTIPELALLGCEHDLTILQGLKNILDVDYRRPHTLAKDELPCQFIYFRKGTAPEDIPVD